MLPAHIRTTVQQLFNRGLSNTEIIADMGDDAPTSTTLDRWRHRGIPSPGTRRTNYSARIIAESVANVIVHGCSRRQIMDSVGCTDCTVGRWVADYAPDAASVDLSCFDDVVSATMDIVVKAQKKSKEVRDAAHKRRTQSNAEPEWTSPPDSDRTIPAGPPVGPIDGEGDELPDDPATLKKMLVAERTKRAIAEGHLHLLGKGVVPAHNRDITEVIVSLRARGHKLSDLLAHTDMAPSTFHRWAAQDGQAKAERFRTIGDEICTIAAEAAAACRGRYVYGYRKIHRVLANRGVRVSEKIVRRIMAERQVVPTCRRTAGYRSYQGETAHRPEHLLLVDDSGELPDGSGGLSAHFQALRATAPDTLPSHDFHADRPGQRLVTDVTEFKCADGKVYLSPLIDLYDGLPISVAVADSPKMTLVMAMLEEGLSCLAPGARPIIHTDRGFHYRAHEWLDATKDIDGDGSAIVRFVPSMSRKGNSGDNAVAEGFFGTVKRELFGDKSTVVKLSRAEVITALDDYIDWYVYGRINARLGYRTLVDHRSVDPDLQLTNAA
ncbi:MAG: IS3 family transposase [Propionibacteriaceae bacterium]|nr:IS3 family transposase [Propionibacteriaceae bacterium]